MVSNGTREDPSFGSLPSPMPTMAAGNHESFKTKIPKRKKARSNTSLSCKIKYHINTNSAYLFGRSEFFTVDSRRCRHGRVYRRRPCASMIAAAPTTTKTMTVASASTEARVSYQLLQSSSMRWPPSKARAKHGQNPSVSKGPASASKNAMLRFVARGLIARQHDLCRTAWGRQSQFCLADRFRGQWTGARKGPALYLTRQLSHRREVRCHR